MKDNKIHLYHILDAIKAIETYLASLSFDGFKNNRQLYDATLMEFIVIGEQVASLTDQFKESHSDIPWHKIVGMRNEISHAYYRINPKVVWDAYVEDLPLLKKYILDIVE